MKAILTIRLDIETDDRSTEILSRIVEAGRTFFERTAAPYYVQGAGTADGFLDTYQARIVEIREPSRIIGQHLSNGRLIGGHLVSGRVIGTVGIETGNV